MLVVSGWLLVVSVCLCLVYCLVDVKFSFFVGGVFLNNNEEGVSVLSKNIRHPDKSNWALIVSTLAYQPYDDCGLDAYYLATQKMYKWQKDKCKQLIDCGASASIVNSMSLRTLAIQAGLVDYLGINQMVMSKEHGSWIVLGAIETDSCSVFESASIEYKDSIDPCFGCMKCVEHCPTQALDEQGNFDAAKCLRSYQCGDAIPPEIASILGNRFLGCNTCQIVCPHNSHIQSIKAPQFVQQAVKNSIFSIKPFKEIIGANYARAKYLTNNAIVYATNTNNLEAIPKIQELAKVKEYEENAKWALTKLKED